MRSESEGPIVLAAFANDRTNETHFLRNLSEEAKRIQSVFEPARELCPLVLLPNATLDEILNAFQKYRNRVAIFHYAGHANGFELLLESAAGGVHHVGAQGLATFLGQQEGLQLVFLNGCSTERQTEDLLNAGVGCVIATTQAIDDGVATEFSARFYNGIVNTAPLQAAYSQAVGSAQAASGGSTHRLIRRKEAEKVDPQVEGRWPWLLKFRPGAERVAQWNLPDAAGDPLFGLPPVPQRDLPESPYRHLYRFEADHAEVFFGRGHEIRELYQRVTSPDSPPVVLFYGPSGVGKSSLLDAGLLPRLTKQCEVHYVRRDPSRGLGETLRSVFPREFRQLARRDAWIATEKQLGRPLVIILDQVEEVFTKPVAELKNELVEFVQLLRRICFAPDRRPQGRLILGFRKEWFAEIDELLAEAQVPRSRVFLDRLSRRGAMEAITGPVTSRRLATQYKLTVEKGLADLIADDLLADPNTPVAPTLQILLTRMWSEACRRNREQPKFDTDLYQSLNRNGILLDDFLRQQTELIRVRLPRAVGSGFLLDLLEFHTTAIGTSAEHPLSLLEQTYSEQSKSGLLQQTLKLCEEMYLLTFSGTGGVATQGSSSPLSPAIDHASGKDLKRGERATVGGPAAPAQPPYPGPLPPSHIHPELPVARGGEGAESHRSSRLLHDTLAPLIRARHEESDSPGQRARRILDNRIVDWMDGKAGIPLDAKDLKEVEAALEGTRSWSADEQRLVTASRDERSSKRKWSRIFKGLGGAAVVAIAVAAGVAEVKTKEATLAQADADAQAASARQELVKSERNLAVNARDREQEFIKSAHHFAAAAMAASKESPEQAARLKFAAGRAITGLSLVSTMETTGMVHEAWMLEDDSICAMSGGFSSQAINYQRQAKDGARSDYPFYPKLTAPFLRGYVSPSGDHFALVSENDVTPILKGREIPEPFEAGGASRASRDASRIVTWGEAGVRVCDLQAGRVQSLIVRNPNDPPCFATISDSGRSVLTWSDLQIPQVWSIQPDGGWTPASLDAIGPIEYTNRGLSPEFLDGTEDFVVWSVNPLRASGFYSHRESGQTSMIHLDFPYKAEPKLQGWTYTKSAVKPGFAFCFWDEVTGSMWCWTLSKPFPTPITPVRLVGPLDMQGLTISPTGHLAIWASEKTWRGTVSKVHVGKPIQFTDQNRSPEDESPPVPEPFELIQTQRVQEAAFSPDGAKLLIWTADSGPQVIQPLGAGANPPGTARVWDPVSGTPLTAPIKYRQSIRGAKFVQNGAGLLVWGEEPVVQHWEIVPSKLPETADKPAFIFEKYDETTSSDKSIVIRSQYVNESQKHRFVMSHNSKPDGSVVTDRKRPVMGIRFTGHAKNMLEWGGEAGAGFVCLWDMEKQSLLTPFYAHPLKVQYAVSNSTDSKILTTTLSTSSGYSPSMKVHLWDVLSNIELMEPLVLHEGAHAGFGSTELEIDVPTNDKWTRFHIDPVPVLSSDDPRWDVVLRTGTYLNDVGEMVRLSHEELLKLRSLSPLERPSFHEWSKGYATQELKFTPMTL